MLQCGPLSTSVEYFMQKRPNKALKQQAHHLKPVVMIGNKGLSDAVHQEIEVALDAHELIKIKINANDQEDKKIMLELILQQHQAQLIQSIGYIAVIYRKNKKKG